MYQIMISPEYEKLKEEVEKLKVSLSMMVMEKDELQHVICRNLETEYMMQLGDLEYQVFRAMCGYKRAKRKSEMIRACINRGESVNIPQIDRELDVEFQSYTQILQEKMKRMNEAIHHRHGRTLSDAETKELKTLYRRIVRRLHPDLNPGVTPEQLGMYERAVESYRFGDLPALRMIDALTQQDVPETTEISLEIQRDHLKESIEHVRKEITEIKARFPYTVKDLLSDPDQIAEKRRILEQQIRDYTAAKETYEAQYMSSMN